LEISAWLAWRNVLRVHAPYAQISAFIKEPWSLAMRSPVLADPFRWQFFLQGERSYYIREVDIRGHVSRFDEVGPRALDDPRGREAGARPAASAWRSFARLPWARVENRNGGLVVGLYDARYQFNPGTSWCSIEVELAPQSPSSGGTAIPSTHGQ